MSSLVELVPDLRLRRLDPGPQDLTLWRLFDLLIDDEGVEGKSHEVERAYRETIDSLFAFLVIGSGHRSNTNPKPSDSVRCMATQPEEIEDIEEAEDTAEDIVEDSGELFDQIRRVVRDEMESLMGSEKRSLPSRDPEEDEPLTMRAVEASVRRAVEDAMEPLRASQKKAQPKKKAAPKKEVEPEPAPTTKDIKTKIQSFLWGSD